MPETDIIDVMEEMEEEIAFVKKSLRDRTVKMGGRLKEASFDEEDFEEAKQSLFPNGS